MNKIIFTISFAFIQIVSAQIDYKKIDKISKTVPDSIKTSTQIATHLTKNLKNDKEKIRAIYIWIAHNIKYVDNFYNIVYENDEELIVKTIEHKAGVCRHFAKLLSEMSNSVGLKTHYISGYTRDNHKKIADTSHAWNSIQIDSNFYLLDVTWDCIHNNKNVGNTGFRVDKDLVYLERRGLRFCTH